jgi:hypothetical protein
LKIFAVDPFWQSGLCLASWNAFHAKDIMSEIAASQIIFDIEEDVASARDFATALALLSETFEEAQGLVVQRIAGTIADRCTAIEENES